jgi:hypothetical protein
MSRNGFIKFLGAFLVVFVVAASAIPSKGNEQVWIPPGARNGKNISFIFIHKICMKRFNYCCLKRITSNKNTMLIFNNLKK